LTSQGQLAGTGGANHPSTYYQNVSVDRHLGSHETF
jgi:hypothetical protein